MNNKIECLILMALVYKKKMNLPEMIKEHPYIHIIRNRKQKYFVIKMTKERNGFFDICFKIDYERKN